MKRLGLILILIISICINVFPVSAAEIDEIQPLYDHIGSIYATLTINETLGIATCKGKIDATEIVPVKVVVRLQQYNDGKWSTVKSWNASGTASVSCIEQYAIYRGYTYRVSVTGYVYDSEGVILESGTVTHTVDF